MVYIFNLLLSKQEAHNKLYDKYQSAIKNQIFFLLFFLNLLAVFFSCSCCVLGTPSILLNDMLNTASAPIAALSSMGFCVGDQTGLLLTAHAEITPHSSRVPDCAPRRVDRLCTHYSCNVTLNLKPEIMKGHEGASFGLKDIFINSWCI